jgi:hypothetical protein
MPHLIHLAMHPPRFIRNGCTYLPRSQPRRDPFASRFDDQQLIDDTRNEFRDHEREGC